MTDTTNGLEPAARHWPRVKWTRASQIASLMGDVPELGAITAMPPAAAFGVLRASDPVAAARFMAHCLPRVDAVRWIAACLAEGDRNPPPTRAVAAKAVRRWVANPTDEARRLAFQAGEVAGLTRWRAWRASRSSCRGDRWPLPVRKCRCTPHPGVFGNTAAGAVLLAAHGEGPPAFSAKLAVMLAKADAIAAGEQPA